MYFAPKSRAPIRLLELGLFARSGRLIVCCGDGFWRRGNVEVVCARNGVPMLFSAGRTPLTEGEMKGARGGLIHWGQDTFDQGGMLREWVKWDYELRHGSDLEGTVDRALAISESYPRGPVYLVLPNEILAEDQTSLTYGVERRMAPTDVVPSDASIVALP